MNNNFSTGPLLLPSTCQSEKIFRKPEMAHLKSNRIRIGEVIEFSSY